jgi:hypothetical protein
LQEEGNMSYPRTNRWFRRLALGLVIAAVLVAGRASVSAAMIDPGPQGSGYTKHQAGQVIPYLSHGMLTQRAADATAAQTDDDPYLTDVYVRPGESLGGPDGGPAATRFKFDSLGDDIVELPADLEPTPRVWPDQERD